MCECMYSVCVVCARAREFICVRCVRMSVCAHLCARVCATSMRVYVVYMGESSSVTLSKSVYYFSPSPFLCILCMCYINMCKCV